MPIDDSELRALIVDIDAAPIRMLRGAEAAAQKAVQNMKDQMVADARSSRSFKQIAGKISYDERHTFRGVEYELGPENDQVVGAGGGPGAAIAYFGGANGGGGTLDFDGPIEQELPRLEAEIRRSLGGAL